MHAFCGQLLSFLVIQLLYAKDVEGIDAGKTAVKTKDQGEIPIHRVIGGALALPGEFRSVVGLEITFQDNQRDICTATALTNQYALTAGQCLHRSKTVIIKINCVDLAKCTNNRMGTGMLHPNFRLENDFFYNNIGIVKSHTPMNAPEYTRLAALSYFPPTCTLVGYGRTTQKPQSTIARLYKITARNIFQCESVFPRNIVLRGLVCAYSQMGKTFHHGDTGSPLYCGNKQAGIAGSFVEIYEPVTRSNTTVMFWTVVNEHTTWIEATISSAGCNSVVASLLVLVLLCITM